MKISLPMLLFRFLFIGMLFMNLIANANYFCKILPPSSSELLYDGKSYSVANNQLVLTKEIEGEIVSHTQTNTISSTIDTTYVNGEKVFVFYPIEYNFSPQIYKGHWKILRDSLFLVGLLPNHSAGYSFQKDIFGKIFGSKTNSVHAFWIDGTLNAIIDKQNDKIHTDFIIKNGVVQKVVNFANGLCVDVEKIKSSRLFPSKCGNDISLSDARMLRTSLSNSVAQISVGDANLAAYVLEEEEELEAFDYLLYFVGFAAVLFIGRPIPKNP